MPPSSTFATRTHSMISSSLYLGFGRVFAVR
jgi:hypothetical protein